MLGMQKATFVKSPTKLSDEASMIVDHVLAALPLVWLSLLLLHGLPLNQKL